MRKSKDPQPRVPKLTQAGLKELGWTKTMIDTLLPEPELKDNPHYKCASPMKLWTVEVVEAVMETPEYPPPPHSRPSERQPPRKPTIPRRLMPSPLQATSPTRSPSR